MSKTENLKIAISGYLGTGKTSLAQELASRLNLQVVNEDAAAIWQADGNMRRAQEAGDDAAVLLRMQDLAQTFLDWSKARSHAIAETDRVVADRWHVDLMIWWMISFRGFRGDAERFTARLRTEIVHTFNRLDYVVITPLLPPFIAPGEANEDGFERKVTGTGHLLFQSLLVGLLADVPKSKIILLPPQPQTVAERADFIEKAIGAVKPATPAVLH